MVLAHNFAQLPDIENVANYRHVFQIFVFGLKFDVDSVQVILSSFEQNELLRMELGELTDKFGPDGTTCACNHQDLTFKPLANGIHVQQNRTSTQKVFNLYLAELTDCGFSVDPISQRWKNLQLHSALPALLQNRLKRASVY